MAYKLCGTPCQSGHYFTHLEEYHPQFYLENQRNATRGLNEKHPLIHKEVMARMLKQKPNHQREAFANLLEKHPNHQSNAGGIGGKVGGAISGKITGPRTISKALGWKKEHPDESISILKKAQEAGNRWMWEHPKEASEIRRKGAMAVQELIPSGAVKRNFAFRGKFPWHDAGSHRHFHRSLEEMGRCAELCESVGSHFLHPNLYFKGIELDWVVSNDPGRFDKDDSQTWSQVIEYHPVIGTWKGEINRQDYQLKRIGQIRKRGIMSEVRFV